MTTFYLIRHAEKNGDPHVLTGRTPGVELSERGRSQAQRLAQHLARCAIERVYSSPVERAQETAEALARPRGLPVQISAAITEVNFGDWTNLTFEELDRTERWRHFNMFRSGTRAPGGETIMEVQARFVSEILRLRDAYPRQGIALVSHADPIRTALAYFLGAPADMFDRFEIGLASVSVLQIADYGAKVLRLNDTFALDG